MTLKNSCTLLFACFLAFSLSACPKKQVKKVTDEKETEEIEDEVESEELDIRDKELVAIPELKTIYFDYDSSALSNEAREILNSNADYLNKHEELDVVAEGHCDERGTIGYNLALGQKRAIAVRKYYLSLGIKPKKSASLSYGKENPVCMESSEECWSQNRRVETKVAKQKVKGGEKEKDEEESSSLETEKEDSGEEGEKQ